MVTRLRERRRIIILSSTLIRDRPFVLLFHWRTRLWGIVSTRSLGGVMVAGRREFFFHLLSVVRNQIWRFIESWEKNYISLTHFYFEENMLSLSFPRYKAFSPLFSLPLPFFSFFPPSFFFWGGGKGGWQPPSPSWLRAYPKQNPKWNFPKEADGQLLSSEEEINVRIQDHIHTDL